MKKINPKDYIAKAGRSILSLIAGVLIGTTISTTVIAIRDTIEYNKMLSRFEVINFELGPVHRESLPETDHLEDLIEYYISNSYMGFPRTDDFTNQDRFVQSLQSREFLELYNFLGSYGNLQVVGVDEILAITRILECEGIDSVRFISETFGLQKTQVVSYGESSSIVLIDRMDDLEEVVCDFSIMQRAREQDFQDFSDYARGTFGWSTLDFETISILSRYDLAGASEKIDSFIALTGHEPQYVPQEFIGDLIEAASDENLLVKLQDPMYKEYGEVYLNDLYLIDLIESDTEIKALFDRQFLLDECRDIYDREPSERERFPQDILPANYNERLPLEEFRTLDLLRIYLLDEALKTEAFQQQIAEIVLEDFLTCDSELGGLIRYSEGGLVLETFPSRERDDDPLSLLNNSYSPSYNVYNLDSIAPFHVHASRTDSSSFAGPSTGDLRYSAFFQSVDVVITSLASESQDMLTIGVDFYRKIPHTHLSETPLDESAIFQGVQILDMGTYVIPIK